MLVRVAHLPQLTDIHGVRMPQGAATLVPMISPTLRLQLGRAAHWETPRKRGESVTWVSADPPQDIVSGVLGSAGSAWQGIPVLAGIAEAPIVRADGSVHTKPGFDNQTGLYHEARAPGVMPLSKTHTTREDTAKLADYVLHPFEEFPFEDRELDQSVLLAYLFTLLLRPQMPLAPLFAVSATAPGTGKGLLIEACNLIVRGRDAAIMSPPGGHNAEDETRKRITALLLQGSPSILLDNWSTGVGGDSMNALLTSAEWSDRVLGQSQTVTLPARVTWAATGNNLTVYGDMVRRTLLAVLDAKTERPELRKFSRPNLARYVLDNRQRLLSALIGIVSAYRRLGEPEREGAGLGRFEEWSRAVAAPIRWLGRPDPVGSQERLRVRNPEEARLSALLHAWRDCLGDRLVSVKDLVEEAQCWTGDKDAESRAALLESLEEIAPGPRGELNRKMLGWYLRNFEGRVCDGLALFKDPNGKKGKPPRYAVAQTAFGAT